MSITQKLDVIELVNDNITRTRRVSTDDASAVANDISALQNDDANTVHIDDSDVSGCYWVVDEDDMTSDDATLVPTQQSVKAYADSVLSDAESYADGLVTDMITSSNTVADLTSLGENNIAAITDVGEIALTPITIAAVNSILTILINAGLMDAP